MGHKKYIPLDDKKILISKF